MITRLIIIAGIIFGLTGLSVMGKPVKPDKPGKISDTTQGKIDKIKKQAKSNDWAGIKKTYAEINWRDGDAVKSLKAVAKEVPKNKNTKDLRREIKTKYELLREDTEDIPELVDVDAYEISIVRAPIIKLMPLIVNTLEIATIPIASLVSQPMSIDVLAMPGLVVQYVDIHGVFQPMSIDVLAMPGLVVQYVDIHGIIVPFIRIDNVRFEKAMSDWSHRWNIAIDAVGTDNIRIIPHPATALGIRRASLMHMIEKKGWMKETEAAWAKYYSDLYIALSRRNLNKKKKK